MEKASSMDGRDGGVAARAADPARRPDGAAVGLGGAGGFAALQHGWALCL